MRFKTSLVVTADDWEHRESGVIEAGDMNDAVEALLSKAPEPPTNARNPRRLSLHVTVKRLL